MRRNKKLPKKLLFGVFCLLCFGVLAVSVSPEGIYVPVFFILLFLSIFFLLGVLTKYSFSIAVATIIYLILKMLSLDNTLNNALLLILTLSLLVVQGR